MGELLAQNVNNMWQVCVRGRLEEVIMALEAGGDPESTGGRDEVQVQAEKPAKHLTAAAILVCFIRCVEHI